MYCGSSLSVLNLVYIAVKSRYISQFWLPDKKGIYIYYSSSSVYLYKPQSIE